MLTKLRCGVLTALIAVAALLLAGCGSGGGSDDSGSDSDSGGTSSSAPATTPAAPDANVAIHGTDHGNVDRIAANAITDIEAFWKDQMPKVFQRSYKPVSGGFYSVDSKRDRQPPPCATDIDEVTENAFYCPTHDLVAYDRTGLFGPMVQNFGPDVVALVLAHEWGHAIQARSREPGQRPVVVESQADCYSGAFTASAVRGQAPHFHITMPDLDKALAGFLVFADAKGDDQDSASAHGNAFDRVSSFQNGFQNGPGYCADAQHYSDHRKFTELPYERSSNRPDQDQADNGNAPYNDAIRLGVEDLNNSFQQLPNWKPVAGVRPIQADQRPSCNGSPITQNVYYCTADNTIYFDSAQHFQQLYDKFGDFAVQSLLATAYGFAYLHDQGKELTGAQALRGAACYSGVYSYQVFVHGRDHKYFISPGDLDEAVQALLLGVDGSSFSGLAGTSGFDRIEAYQSGFQAAYQVGFDGTAAQGATVCAGV